MSRAAGDPSHEDSALGFWWAARLVLVLVLADVVAQAIGRPMPGKQRRLFAWLVIVVVVATVTAVAIRPAHRWFPGVGAEASSSSISSTSAQQTCEPLSERFRVTAGPREMCVGAHKRHAVRR